MGGGGFKGKVFSHCFEKIISVENLLASWRKFSRGKRDKKDVEEFSLFLMDNILELRTQLVQHTYTHGSYQAFSINDPKPRRIHKASVGDRLVHHAIYRILYPLFDRVFISDSYSCRVSKGQHRAINRFREFSRKVSNNNTGQCWILKCDIRKFFNNIDHEVLIRILNKRVQDKNCLNLLVNIIKSFSIKEGKGLPLGNLTSQLLVNIYMNEFDQFMKHKIKAKYYIRYADDFVILSQDKTWLEELLPMIEDFLSKRLKLDLHPNKVSICTFASGIDFLGWIHFPNHRVLRTSTKKRMFRNIKNGRGNMDTIQSYLGLIKYGNSKKIESQIYKLVDN